jgi:hypothetical protein
MTNLSLIIPGTNALEHSITPAALEVRQNALDRAGLVRVVKNEATNQAAVDALREIMAILKTVESERNRLKKPLWEAGKHLDAMAAYFGEDLKREKDRLDRITSDYQSILQEQRNEAARKQQEELRRIQEELAAKQREAEAKAAEEARIAREAVEKSMREAKNEEQRRKAAADAVIALQEAEKREQQRMEQDEALATQQREMALASNGPAKAEGQTVSERWEFEVTDIHKLYRSNPNCVELTERKSSIRELINLGVTNIPGVRCWKGVRAGVTTRTGQPILV